MTMMNTSSALVNYEYPMVVSFEDYKNNHKKGKNVRYNKDGTIDKRTCHKIAGQSSEVYAFKTKEEIASMIKVFDKHIEEAVNNNQKQIAFRNKLLFIIGMNIGIRSSDLRTLKWSFFFEKNNDGTLNFKKFYVLQPLKQKKYNKFVKLFFNQTVQMAINSYVSKYPVDDLDEYLFASRKGEEPISAKSICRIIKDVAVEAGIEQNIGSHSLRKSFGFWCWHQAEDKNKALVILQSIFSHSNTQITAKYIGILDDEIEDMFNNIELGIDMI